MPHKTYAELRHYGQVLLYPLSHHLSIYSKDWFKEEAEELNRSVHVLLPSPEISFFFSLNRSKRTPV